MKALIPEQARKTSITGKYLKIDLDLVEIISLSKEDWADPVIQNMVDAIIAHKKVRNYVVLSPADREALKEYREISKSIKRIEGDIEGDDESDNQSKA